MGEDPEAAKPEAETDREEKPSTPSKVLAWIRIWLTDPNREKSKFTDIAIVVLTTLIACAALWSAWLFESQLGEMRRTTILDQRAWLQITAEKFNWQTGVPIVWPIQVTDIGKTMARGLDGCVAIEYLQKGQEPSFNYTPGTGHPCTKVIAGILYPNAPHEVPLPLFVPVPPHVKPREVMNVTPELYSTIMRGDSYIAIHGRITYDDVFGHHHWITFCQLTTPLLIQWDVLSKTCMPYNSTDHND